VLAHKNFWIWLFRFYVDHSFNAVLELDSEFARSQAAFASHLKIRLHADTGYQWNVNSYHVVDVWLFEAFIITSLPVHFPGEGWGHASLPPANRE